MTKEFLSQHSYVYSVSSCNWYFPSRSIRAVHNIIYNALRTHEYHSKLEVKGIQEVSDVYHAYCTNIPSEHIPDGVFTSATILTTRDGKQYFIFTDIERLY